VYCRRSRSSCPTRLRSPRTPHAIHEDKDLDSELESEDDDDDYDDPRGADGKRPLTTCQTALAGVVGSSHVSLDEISRKKKQLKLCAAVRGDSTQMKTPLREKN